MATRAPCICGGPGRTPAPGLGHANPRVISAIPAKFRYNDEKLCNETMGEVMELTSTGLPFGTLTAVFSLAALGIYALTQGSSENDDDDSSPGGGLMQPVA